MSLQRNFRRSKAHQRSWPEKARVFCIIYCFWTLLDSLFLQQTGKTAVASSFGSLNACEFGGAYVIRNAFFVARQASMERVIISCDPGIFNLAISCVSQKEGAVRILYWKNHNVTDLGGESVKVKKKKLAPDVEMGFCQSTVKKTKKICGKRGPLNSKGRAYCGVHNPATKHSTDDTQRWTFSLLQALPKIAADIMTVIPQNSQVEVVIERQCSTNQRIAIQGHLIYGFWVDHFRNTVPVTFFAAYNKLLAYNGPEIVSQYKTPYARRKDISKKQCEWYLSEKPELREWLPFFTNNKAKGDDLSDAFLQSLFVLLGKSTSGSVEPKRPRRKLRF